MAKEYLERLTALIQQLSGEEFNAADIECKHFFSGAAGYVNGKIFISLTPAGLALKLPSQSRNMLLQKKGARELRYFPKGPIKKDYVVLPDRIQNDRRELQHWVIASVTYVRTLSDTL